MISYLKYSHLSYYWPDWFQVLSILFLSFSYFHTNELISNVQILKLWGSIDLGFMCTCVPKCQSVSNPGVGHWPESICYPSMCRTSKDLVWFLKSGSRILTFNGQSAITTDFKVSKIDYDTTSWSDFYFIGLRTIFQPACTDHNSHREGGIPLYVAYVLLWQEKVLHINKIQQSIWN